MAHFGMMTIHIICKNNIALFVITFFVEHSHVPIALLVQLTVTAFARLWGISGFIPRNIASLYASNCNGKMAPRAVMKCIL
jgi:hypothetical protein